MTHQDHHVPGSPCRLCGQIQDGALEAMGEGTPEEGSISICMDCSALSVYDKDLQQREPTPAEWRSMMDDTEFWNQILKMRYLLRQVREERKKE